MVPSKTMAATMAAVKQQQMLMQQQKQRNSGQNGNGKSSDLPDFFTSKNDMGKCFENNVYSVLKIMFICYRVPLLYVVMLLVHCR